MFRTICFILTFFITLVSQNALSALRIEITQGVEGAIPISIAAFDASKIGQPPEDVAEVISSDLQRSGRFSPVPRKDHLEKPSRPEDVHFENWRSLNSDYLVIGQVLPNPPKGYTLRFYVFDVFKGTEVLAYDLSTDANLLRRAAHEAADIIYEKLTGEKGAFNTRIAFISAVRGGEGAEYRLQVADSDGHNEQTVLRSKEPLLSPSWSPNGDKLAYVSFEKGKKSAVYVQNLFTASRQVVANFDGINSAPAWSPDGQKLALSLSKDGNPEIYVLDVGSRNLSRLTRNLAIDTEPVWSPDGQSLVFTSDRGGSPQIYRVSVGGGGEERMTFEGSYNARPAFSPDGHKLAMVYGGSGGYKIAVLDMESRALQVLTDGPLDESPRFAPNGNMIIYAAEHGGKGVLSAVSIDGRVRQRLDIQKGDVREPSWSPFNK